MEKPKYRGLWTPQYLAENILFPKPISIQAAEVKLESWAYDIVEENTEALKTLLDDLRLELEKQKDQNAILIKADIEQVTEIQNLNERNRKLEAFVAKIKNWELPATGEFFVGDPSRPVSFEACHGSNGVRDYFKGLASELLIINYELTAVNNNGKIKN